MLPPPHGSNSYLSFISSRMWTAALTAGMQTFWTPDEPEDVLTQLEVYGMCSEQEFTLVKRKLENLPGVSAIRVNLLQRQVLVTHEESLEPARIVRTLNWALLDARIVDTTGGGSSRQSRVSSVGATGGLPQDTLEQAGLAHAALSQASLLEQSARAQLAGLVGGSSGISLEDERSETQSQSSEGLTREELTGLSRLKWTAEEDAALLEHVKEQGAQSWSVLANKLPGRLGKQCRERCVPAPRLPTRPPSSPSLLLARTRRLE